jgi:hypothetical protein
MPYDISVGASAAAGSIATTAAQANLGRQVGAREELLPGVGRCADSNTDAPVQPYRPVVS